MDSNNYEGKINHIEISQARSKQKGDFLTEEEQSAMRSELGKLMWLARIARPDAIYNASAAAQNFANFEPENCDVETSFAENEKGILMLIIINRVIPNAFLGLKMSWGINPELRIRRISSSK